MFGEIGKGGGGSGNGNLGFGNNGPAYNFDFGGFQVGDDLFAHTDRDNAGLYFNATSLRSYVQDASSLPAGWLAMDGYGVGAYWTHRDPNGWYTDLALQMNWYENIRTRSVAGEVFDTNGWGFAASAETGYIFSFTNGYSIIPQGQVIYQRTSIDSGADSFGQIVYRPTDEVYGRLGVRLAKGWFKEEIVDTRRITLWTEANFWHQFGDYNATTTFSSLDGTNPTALTASLGGTWAQFGLGLSGQITNHVSAFGAADYNIEMERVGHSVGGQAGITVAW